MKLRLLIVLAIVLLACQAGAGEKLGLKTQKDIENYNAGVRIARSLQQLGGEINLDIVIQGMKDELTGERHILTEDDLSETMVASQNELKQVCRVIDDQELYEAICKRNNSQVPASSQAQAQKQRSDEEQTFSALFCFYSRRPPGKFFANRRIVAVTYAETAACSVPNFCRHASCTGTSERWAC